jgi:ketosteroid isomerase-like protein
VLADYADDAVLLTMGGAFVGKTAIQGFFVNSLSAMPNARISFTGHVVHGDFVLNTWTGDSDVATIPHGADSFVIEDDKIRRQTVWFTVVPK